MWIKYELQGSQLPIGKRSTVFDIVKSTKRPSFCQTRGKDKSKVIFILAKFTFKNLRIKKFESIELKNFEMTRLKIIHILIYMIKFPLELSDLVAMQ